MVTVTEETLVAELLSEIDAFLARISDREIVGAGEVADFALDLRLVCARHKDSPT